MSAWIEALLARPESKSLAITDPPASAVTPAKGDWVLALAALVLGQTERQEARHA
jgi:hypothetical protein